MSAPGAVVLGPAKGRGGWLAQRDARLRVVAAVAFALVVLGLHQIPALLAALVLALALAMGGGLTWSQLGRRLLVLEGLMALLMLTLPFTVPGTPVLDLGLVAASREGLLRALLILLKANAVALALMGLVGGLEPVVLGHALGRLRVPEKLVHLLLQTVRQIHLLHEEHRRLRQAMRARAFVARSDRHTWNSYGWLIGMLLVRALDRSRRVMGAMRCRGFRGRLYLLDSPSWGAGDGLAALSLGLALGAVLALERLL